MTVVFSGIEGLTILEINGEIKIVDNDLQVYDSWDACDPFVDENECHERFIKATEKYYEGTPYPQFKELALKEYNEFIKTAAN